MKMKLMKFNQVQKCLYLDNFLKIIFQIKLLYIQIQIHLKYNYKEVTNLITQELILIKIAQKMTVIKV